MILFDHLTHVWLLLLSKVAHCFPLHACLPDHSWCEGSIHDMQEHRSISQSEMLRLDSEVLQVQINIRLLLQVGARVQIRHVQAGMLACTQSGRSLNCIMGSKMEWFVELTSSGSRSIIISHAWIHILMQSDCMPWCSQQPISICIRGGSCAPCAADPIAALQQT